MATRIRRAGVAVALALLMATALAGAVWAADRVGTNDSDLLIGTDARDTIYGLKGPDDLFGGRSTDVIEAADAFHEQDYVNCGPSSFDRASVDKQDTVERCEIVNGEPVD